MNPKFRYNIGDLVSWKGSLRSFMGIVIEQRLVFTADNRFKVQTDDGVSWVGADQLTLVSRGGKNEKDPSC